jgi:hypothetical protein
MNFRRIALIFGFISENLLSQGIPSDSIEIGIQASLRFIVDQQITHTIPEYQYAGEWPSIMTMRKKFALLGKQSDSYDSNCFSTSSIHNSLAAAYIIRPDLLEIPPMLDAAIIRISDFYEGDGFNFWPKLLPKGRLYMFHQNNTSGFVRRPIRFPLNSPYIRKAANVVNDNDDSAQGYTAFIYYSKVRKILGENNEFYIHLSPILGVWRDTARHSQHYYNIIHFDKKESGAFLTWRALEEPFPSWNIPRLIINNALFLTPLSTLFPYAFKPYIPYGANDVDAVVNANVLSAYGENSEFNAIGIKQSALFIERKAKRKDWSRAGIYYPNRYHFHYATLRAWAKGISELNQSATLLKQHLLESQLPDGSFSSRKIVNQHDIIQSSAYALNAMLRFGDPLNSGFISQIDKTIRFLFKQGTFSNNQLCWDGGVFFSGGTVIRNTLYWKSDVYTTSLILESLVMYQDFINKHRKKNN